MSIYKLSLVFSDADNKNVTFTLPYTEPNVQAGHINTFMDAVITNGVIFPRPPVTKKSASLVKTDTTVFDVTEE